MNELSVREENKAVTTKELASILGVEPRTVQLAVQRLGLAEVLSQVKIRGQYSYVFTEEQATLVKQHIQDHHNLASRQIDTVTTATEEDQMIAQAWAILNRRIQDANKEIERLKPAAEFAYQICSSKDAIDIGNCAKVLNRNIGRNNLFEFLRNKKILQSDNIPYQKYIDSGYFRVIETKYTIPSGETKISLKTLVLQKGVAYINKLLKERDS